MQFFLSAGFIILGLCGLIFLFAGIVQTKFPPKKINSLYGYRTSSSMRSQEAWDYAQKYSAKVSIWVGVIMIIFGLIFLLLPNISNDYRVWFSLLIIFTLVAFLIISTEIKLKRKFGKK